MVSHHFLFRLVRITLVIWLVFTAGCALRPERTAGDSEKLSLFMPPTLVPTPSPIADLPSDLQLETTGMPGASSSQTDCLDGLTYIADITIPDDTVVVAGSTMDKRWEVENSGTCNWGDGYEVRMISGDSMGAETVQALPPARSGTRSNIRINFSAPTTPGTYRSDWQAYNPAGLAFGDAFYLQIIVGN